MTEPIKLKATVTVLAQDAKRCKGDWDCRCLYIDEGEPVSCPADARCRLFDARIAHSDKTWLRCDQCKQDAR